MATKEAKQTSGASLEEKKRSGTIRTRSGFGAGIFGYARFDEKSGYETTKEAKQRANRTLEAKP